MPGAPKQPNLRTSLMLSLSPKFNFKITNKNTDKKMESLESFNDAKAANHSQSSAAVPIPSKLVRKCVDKGRCGTYLLAKVGKSEEAEVDVG